MKKRIILKDWLVKILATVIASWMIFCAVTIESLGNPTYNKILVIWTGLALLSFYLLKKYSKVFEEED